MRTGGSKNWASGSGVDGAGEEVSDRMVSAVSWGLVGASMRAADENSRVGSWEEEEEGSLACGVSWEEGMMGAVDWASLSVVRGRESSGFDNETHS